MCLVVTLIHLSTPSMFNSLTHHISLHFSPRLIFCQLIFLPRQTLLPISPCVPTLSFCLQTNSPTVKKLTFRGQPSLLCWRRRDLFSAEAVAHVPFRRESAAQPSVCSRRCEEAAREAFDVSSWLPMNEAAVDVCGLEVVGSLLLVRTVSV